ncbi:MAG: hypothetical protein GY754_19185 [bacterium]|nr:hypothetical protein [bacterium]
MKRITLFMLTAVFVFSIVGSVFAAATASRTRDFVTTDGTNTLDDNLNDALDSLAADVQSQLDGKWNNQEDLATGFGNATHYSSQAATLFGYQGYDLFAVMAGFMLGAQLPSFSPSELTEVPKKIEENGDVYAGMAAGLAIQVGINCSFLIEDLYISAKFGYLPMKLSEVDATIVTFGAMANYQLIKEQGILFDLLKWRGISVGAGLMYSSNSTTLTVDGLGSLSVPISGTGDTGGGNMTLSPSISLELSSSTFAVPIEVSTSVRLLWILNIHLGAGIDLVFGSTDITLSQASDVSLDSSYGTNSITQDGQLTVKAGTEGTAPEWARARLMTGVGLGFGPVVIDVPVTWYLSSGINVGISAGIIW